MFIFENKSTNTPCPFEIRGYFDDDSHVVIGKYYSKNQAEYQLDRIIKALNENSAKVLSTTTDDKDKSYNTPPKSGSDAKKPDKLSDKEIEEAIEKVLKMELATRLLRFEE
jgi:hypothetical protein